MRKKIKRLLVLIAVFLLVFIHTTSYGKYIIEYTNTVANIVIDNVIPKIKIIDIQNTNIGYEEYASSKHEITIKVRVNEKNILENHFQEEGFVVAKVGGKVEPLDKIVIKKLEEKNDYIDYEIKLKGLEGNGLLKLSIKKATIKDISENTNFGLEFNLGIEIDNIVPQSIFSEKQLLDGKVEASVQVNEKVRPINAWNISDDGKILRKEFASKNTYPLSIIDYAQNIAKAEIDVRTATSINFKYGSYNKNANWSYGYGNNETAGKSAVLLNPLYKTEIVAFNTNGNIEDDFIQVQSYIHTYWGEGAEVSSSMHETMYYHGYNPSKTSFSSMKSGSKVGLNQDYYFILGGEGVNSANKKALNIRKGIPLEIADKYLFGISGLKIKLKDTSYYSIVYQILVDGQGWLETMKNGQEAVYKHDKPFTAFRASLIPKTEEQYLIDEWNKDIGTYNLE